MLKSADLASQTQDDGFHEIQLNGKQLVFLFMAATVVSVVIFLCGVLVGRGVRAERAATIADAGTVATVPPPDTPPASATQPAPAGGSDPTAAAPPPAVDDLSYFDRLEKRGTPAEDLKPEDAKPTAGSKARAPIKPEPTKADAVKSTSAPKPETAKASAVQPTAPAESAVAPGGDGYAVQVAALNVRGEADAIARRLSAKGYAAYVVAPANGASMFRVRVGKFPTRREAEAIAAKLQKEEQFKPWVTR